MNKVEIFQECHNILGEGALWSNSTNTLFWLDIPMPSKLYSYSFDTREYNTYAMPEMITALAESKSNLLIASHYGLNNYNLDEKKFEPIIKMSQINQKIDVMMVQQIFLVTFLGWNNAK